MQTFLDKNGKKWNIELTVGTAKRAKSECDIDFFNVITMEKDKVEAKPLEKLSDDPVLLVETIYSLCQDQAKECDISPEAFAMLFNAQAIIDATNAMIEEIINFSPAAKKKVLQKINEKGKDFAAKVEQKLDTLLESKELAEEIEEEMEEQLKSLSTAVQESSE